MTSIAAALGSATTWTRATAFLVMGAAASDAWHFHSFGVTTDLTLFVGAAAALGVHVATQSIAATVAKASNTPAGQ